MFTFLKFINDVQEKIEPGCPVIKIPPSIKKIQKSKIVIMQNRINGGRLSFLTNTFDFSAL
jgi:hypothetical protein